MKEVVTPQKKRPLGKAVAQGPTFHFPFFCVKFFRNKRAVLWATGIFTPPLTCQGTSTSFSSHKTKHQNTGSYCDCPRICPTKQSEERVTRASQFLYNLLEIPQPSQDREWRLEKRYIILPTVEPQTGHSIPSPDFQTGDFL